VFEEAGIGLHVKEVIDGNNLQGFGVSFDGRLDDLTTDSAESVYSYSQHVGSSLP